MNLSARQLGQPDVVEVVAEVLRETGLAPSRLGLEITESALMEDVDSALGKLSALRQLGVRLLLDDFGTGYSSLSHLRQFPFDVVKIDRSFVATLGETEDSGAILAAVVQMAGALGMAIVAEGVETKEQLECVTALGYDLVQGFYFDRPMTAAALRARYSATVGLAATG